MRDPALDQRSQKPSHPTRSPSHSSSSPKLAPGELALWLENRAERLVDRWLDEVRARDRLRNHGVEELVAAFLELFVSMLPAGLGPYREQVEPLWGQAAELFGSLAARRGLAAGEVIEEFQLLRESLIRLLYDDPPTNGGAHLSLRDMLRLNRTIDRGVTQASVGHTDAMFFALFGGSGVPEAVDEELVAEVHAQLDAIRDEFRTLMRALRR